MPVETVIVAMDWSPFAKRAAHIGELLARSFDASLRLVHVIDRHLPEANEPELMLPDDCAADRYLRAIASEISGDVPASAVVIHGDVAQVLLEMVEEHAGTLLVLSPYCWGGHPMRKRVVDTVLRSASQPVALVRRSSSVGLTTIGRLLVPLDGSEFAEMALPLAAELARRTKATLHLVRVVEPSWHDQSGAIPPYAHGMFPEVTALEAQLLTRERARLIHVSNDLCRQGVMVAWNTRIGHVGTASWNSVDDIAADLLLVPAHRWRRTRR
jgi:nucleotide-binding universal stress UspA family protein